MEIYTALKNDHDKHRDLLAKIDETSGDSERRRELWGEFYCSVKSHAAAEEETFYAALMKDADGQPKARHSVAEHKELDDLERRLTKEQERRIEELERREKTDDNLKEARKKLEDIEKRVRKQEQELKSIERQRKQEEDRLKRAKKRRDKDD